MNAIKIPRARPDAALIGKTDSHNRPANIDRRQACIAWCTISIIFMHLQPGEQYERKPAATCIVVCYY